MTNGLPDVYATANLVCGIRPDTNINRDEFWKYITACNWVLFESGERWMYGNTGYFLLGEVIRALTNKSLSQYADEYIFKPLGMNNTFIRDDRAKIIKNRAVGYSNYNNIHFNDYIDYYSTKNDKLCINHENVDVGGAGQLWTTVRDFFLWDKNFYNNILGERSNSFIKSLITPGILNSGKKCGYGWGLWVDDFYGNKIINHDGLAGGYCANYVQLPEKKSSIIVMGNKTDFIHDFMYENKDGLIHNILKLIVGCTDESIYSRGISCEEISVEADICQDEIDINISGMYIEPISGRVQVIEKKNSFYFVGDRYGNSVRMLYYGNGIFKSEDKKQIYIVQRNEKSLLKYIEFEDLKNKQTFYPFCQSRMNNSDFNEYVGSYYCPKLGVSYYVKTNMNKLFISNENRQNNALDFYYTPAIRDIFVIDLNQYVPYYCVIFHRDSRNRIISFAYKDGQETLLENFVFVKREEKDHD